MSSGGGMSAAGRISAGSGTRGTGGRSATLGARPGAPRASAAGLALAVALAAGASLPASPAAAPSGLALPAPSAPTAEMRGSALESGTRRPLAGAVATLYSDSEKGAHYLTSSDPSGRFLFRGLPAGTYTLEVALPGYRTARKHALEVRPPFRSIVEVVLEPGSDAEAGAPAGAPPGARGSEPAGATGAAPEGEPAGAGAPLIVTLTDREQRPVPEALVALVPVDGEGERRTARTDAAGRVEFESLPPRRYRLTASAPGYLTVRTERLALAEGSAARVAIILTPYPLDFTGSVEDLLPPEEPLPPERAVIRPDEP